MRIENPFKIGFLATLGALIALTLGGMVESLSTVLTYIATALFLALGFDPAISWLERRRWPRWAAVLVLIVGVIVVAALVVWAIVPSITAQVNEISTRYGAIIGDIVNSNAVEWLTVTFPALDVQAMVAQAASWLQGNLGAITGGVFQVGVGIVNGLFATMIVTILTIYFVASLPSIKRAFYQLSPASSRPRVAELSERITGSVGAYVLGMVTLALVNGVLTFIFLSIVGAAMPMVFAVIAFIGSMIPMIGTISASAIIVLAQLLLLEPGSPVWWIAAIYYVVYMQVEAYILTPRVMSRAVQVPGAIVVIAALTGGTLLGLLGALVAIPVAASLMIIIKEVLIPRQNER
ncbi:MULTISPECIES: AI-2E family transporter [Gulosibacter]|uniref:AI-2E family transporter n=1 Tax=Gulosibacter TaxID=256818 RepID=UPI000F63DF39|nr:MULTISPECIES: AI-2E family transporter [Gulosibacter]